MAAVVVGAMALVSEVGAAEEQVSVTIATGRVGGLYHPVGGVICKLAAEYLDALGVSCTVDTTGGSKPNIKDLRKGNADLAIVQSDLQHDAFVGTGPFEDEGPFANLRSMFALYVEHFTVVARDDRDIDAFDDLKGKRVYVGEAASSRREAMNVLMEAHGWTGGEIAVVSEFEGANLAEALCDGEFDAFVYTIGHPNPTVREATTLCDAKLLEISAPIIEKLSRENRFYVGSVIPGGTYKGIPQDIRTLGVVSTLLTTAEVPSDVIYAITKAYFENLETLQALSPLFLSLTKGEMVETGLTAPIHEGALKYFSEVDLK
jgi:TRAP transporter TAXI family solute receptor